ncbi:SPOR domain-containing protein [Vibrio marisflavi]|uniref:Cell division protein DamX n=1 Tax=Vibrio marisflavi CECT 7928 TaxID=634439 RepID=A0ABM9A057_9VIBR|nr:SPOR domain-containing protein [Vibrio marisflavi]CAH0536865.1 Cell division protein DamX [Vibrio marisflavi CECT 7928]
MKKIAIVGISALLSACSTGTYTVDVSSESYREAYPVAKVDQPVVSQDGMMNGVTEQNVTPTQKTIVPSSSSTAAKTAKAKPAVAIIPPTAKQIAKNPRFGYTIQVVAVGTQTKVDQFARQLPTEGQPIWENYKVVNGTKWYTVLYGDYATRTEAKKAIATLPMEFKNLKPFVKSIDAIKNSEYPTLNKLN